MLALAWDAINGGADLAYSSGSLATGDELETAAYLSLFCDAPARDTDPIPEGHPRGGWWGDAYAEEEGDVWGSRLWTLRRHPMTDATPGLAIEMIEDALAWMVQDGIAESITGIAEVYAKASNTLAIGAQIRRPGEIAPRFVGLWNSVTGDRI